MKEFEVKYFLSGASGIRPDVMPRVASMIDFRLLSMHKAFKGNTRIWCDISHHADSGMREVMLDSGAFTAFMKGHKVTLDYLIAIYDDTLRKLNKKLQVWLINLDVIPGAFGRVADPAEIVEAMSRSDENYKALKRRYGSRVLPVYHQTEGEERLNDILSMNDYVAMGFRQDFAEEHRINHAQECLTVAAKQRKKVHGLATTGYKMLSRAPFDTVDSATWLYIAAMGGVSFVDDVGDMQNVAVSSSSPRQRELRQHFISLDPREQALIASRAEDAGVTMTQLAEDLSYRILFNAHQMREWLRAFRRPVVLEERGLFPL